MQVAAVIGIVVAVIGIVVAVFVAVLGLAVGVAFYLKKKMTEAPSNRNQYRNAAVAHNGPFLPVAQSSIVLPSIIQTVSNTAQMSSAAFGNHVLRNVPFAYPVEEVGTFRLNRKGRYVEDVVSLPGYGVSRTPREALRVTEGTRGGGAASEHVLRRSETGAWGYAKNNDGSEFIVQEKSRRSQRRKRASSRR